VTHRTSDLSLENVLRDVHDPVTQTLRTTGEATVVAPGGIEVQIDHTNDSISLGNGVDLLTTTTAGGKVALDVNVVTPLVDISNVYGESTSVPTNTPTAIVNFLVTGTDEHYLQTIDFAGQNIAEYYVTINGVTVNKAYINFGTPLNGRFDFTTNSATAPGLPVQSGDSVVVWVNNPRPDSANFNARIQILNVG
jgi:hypothetical protein